MKGDINCTRVGKERERGSSKLQNMDKDGILQPTCPSYSTYLPTLPANLTYLPDHLRL